MRLLSILGLIVLVFFLNGCGRTDGVRASLSRGGGAQGSTFFSRGPSQSRPNTNPFINSGTHSDPDGNLEIKVNGNVEKMLRSLGSDFLASNSCFVADRPLGQSGAQVNYYDMNCSQVIEGDVPQLVFQVRAVAAPAGRGVSQYELIKGTLKVGLVQGYAARGAMFGGAGYQLVKFCEGEYLARVLFNTQSGLLDIRRY